MLLSHTRSLVAGPEEVATVGRADRGGGVEACGRHRRQLLRPLW